MTSFFAGTDSSGQNSDAARQSTLQMLGPQAVDQAIRQVISMCWMMLPDAKKSAENVDAEIRRLMARALEDMREDCKAFGIPDASQSPDRAGQAGIEEKA